MIVSKEIQERLDKVWSRLQAHLTTQHISQIDLDEMCCEWIEGQLSLDEAHKRCLQKAVKDQRHPFTGVPGEKDICSSCGYKRSHRFHKAPDEGGW